MNKEFEYHNPDEELRTESRYKTFSKTPTRLGDRPRGKGDEIMKEILFGHDNIDGTGKMIDDLCNESGYIPKHGKDNMTRSDKILDAYLKTMGVRIRET